MMDKEIETEEKIRIVDHFTQQLCNSGYKISQIRNIVESSLKGIKRKEIIMNNRENRYKNANETLEERMIKKLTESTSWYKRSEKSEEKDDTDKDKILNMKEFVRREKWATITLGGEREKEI